MRIFNPTVSVQYKAITQKPLWRLFKVLYIFFVVSASLWLIGAVSSDIANKECFITVEDYQQSVFASSTNTKNVACPTGEIIATAGEDLLVVAAVYFILFLTYIFIIRITTYVVYGQELPRKSARNA